MPGTVLNNLHLNITLMYIFAILGIEKQSWIQIILSCICITISYFLTFVNYGGCVCVSIYLPLFLSLSIAQMMLCYFLSSGSMTTS